MATLSWLVILSVSYQQISDAASIGLQRTCHSFSGSKLVVLLLVMNLGCACVLARYYVRAGVHSAYQQVNASVVRI